MAYRIKVRGLKYVKSRLWKRNARRLKRKIDDDLEEGIREMARVSFNMAPVETGELKLSILNSVQKVGKSRYMYGSQLPYAQRQEYEHKTKRFYFRRSVIRTAPKIQDKIAKTVRKTLGG